MFKTVQQSRRWCWSPTNGMGWEFQMIWTLRSPKSLAKKETNVKPSNPSKKKLVERTPPPNKKHIYIYKRHHLFYLLNHPLQYRFISPGASTIHPALEAPPSHTWTMPGLRVNTWGLFLDALNHAGKPHKTDWREICLGEDVKTWLYMIMIE